MAAFSLPFPPRSAILSATGSTGLVHCQPPRFGCCPPALRAAIEGRIERLIGLLDRIDGDADFEWHGDETDDDGDDLDQSFPEWIDPALCAGATPKYGWNRHDTADRDCHSMRGGRPCLAAMLEDSELDDFGEQSVQTTPTYGVDQTTLLELPSIALEAARLADLSKMDEFGEREQLS